MDRTVLRRALAAMALMSPMLAIASMNQVSYVEEKQPTVRVSASNAVAGLALRPAMDQKNHKWDRETTFQAKLPRAFKGDLVLEITTHDHDFQATVAFNGTSEGGWELLSINPNRADGKRGHLPELEANDNEVAVRAHIVWDDPSKQRRLVPLRWGPAKPPEQSGDRLRVQLNVGNAYQAALWLVNSQSERTAATCAPLSGRTHVFFRWNCEFPPGIGLNEKFLENAKLIVARRERDGSEQFESTTPAW